MSLRTSLLLFLMLAAAGPGRPAAAQPYGEPDRGQPGDAMIQAHLARLATEMDARFLDGVASADDWTALRTKLQREFLYMLGLDPLPPRTPLKATVTGTVEGDGYVVENLHYQSVPGLYVTGNLYRPARSEPGAKLPAIFYVCGHSGMGRDGNKTAFQSHGIWLARHGYVCLVVDTLQLGEIAATHHGTYREGRWWWHSRGYTPAGVEAWNGVRGIDYLTSRPDVDPDRIGVTGISGGGAVTFWIAGADDRVKVAVPVSGMADLESYAANRVVNGHCDCMFLHNTFEWPWTRIAGLVAPRPMLFVNSDQDRIFPMDANERVIARLERLYSHFGAGDRVDAVVSVGGHDYRRDIRQSAFRFLNAHLKGDAHPVDDTEVDLVEGSGSTVRTPIPPARLRVFAGDLPSDQSNTTIDQHFVPQAKVEPPAEGGFEPWRAKLLAELRRVTFRPIPDRVPPARTVEGGAGETVRLETEPGIVVPLRKLAGPDPADAGRLVLVVAGPGTEDGGGGWKDATDANAAVYLLQPRGVGATRWTRKNPPNYVERSYVLVGRTPDGDRVRDILATAAYLASQSKGGRKVELVGEGAAGILAAYAAALEPGIGGVTLVDPPASHMEPEAPALLNVLRVLDIPEALGLIAPRPLAIRGGDEALHARVSALYARAGAGAKLERR